jgi:hypothetical protein
MKHYPKAQSFVSRSKAIEVLLEDLESCPLTDVDQKLANVIVACCELSNRTWYRPYILRNVGEQELQPNIWQGLERRLEKLARYSELSSYLLRAAEVMNLLRHVQVTSVSLSASCFSTPTWVPSPLGLDKCVSRCCGKDKQVLSRVCQNFIEPLPLSKARKQFDATTEAAVKESKIHAEMQILAHYHLNPSRRPPRIIAASKDACYLCNKLIELDGQFTVQGSHGRLYQKWRLPTLQVFDNLQDRLNRYLESKIARASRRSWSQRRATLLTPYESPLLPLADLSTMIPSSSDLGRSPDPKEIDHDQMVASDDEHGTGGDDSEGSDIEDTNIEGAAVEQAGSEDTASDGSETDTVPGPTTEPPTPSAFPVPGIFINLQPASGRWSQVYEQSLVDNFMNILLGKEVGERKLEWLTDKDARNVAYERSKVPARDLQALQERSNSEEDGMLLKHRGKLVRMNVVRF